MIRNTMTFLTSSTISDLEAVRKIYEAFLYFVILRNLTELLVEKKPTHIKVGIFLALASTACPPDYL